MYTIYCHIFPNGKRYIGLTKTSLDRRWDNGNSYKTCPLVNRAINKYGWDNVNHTILATTKTKEEAEEKERYYIAEFKTNDPDFGYNILPGGDVADNVPTDEMRKKLGNGWRGKSRSQEEKEKISTGVKKKFQRPESNGHIGMKATEETKKKMSLSQTKSWEDSERKRAASARMKERMSDPDTKKKVTDNLSLYRRKKGEWNMSEQAKKKLSEHNKGKWVGEKSPTSKPVLQYTVDGQFVKRWSNAGEAERAGIALRNNISKCCRNKAHCKTAGGFVWKFEQ